MVQIIVKRPATSLIKFRTYRFTSLETARFFVVKFKLENKIVDIA